MKTLKSVFLIAALLLVSEARAVTVVVPPGGGGYPYDTNLQTDTFNTPPTPWNGNPIQQQDKLWTYVSSSTGLDNAPIHLELLTLAGIEHHRITLADNDTNFTLGAGTYELVYTIQVTDPNRVINEVTLAVDGVTSDGGTSVVDVVKTLRDAGGAIVATLHSIGGSGVDVTFPGVSFLTVDEVITVSPGGAVTSTTNTYVQNVVPEPATLAIWGVLGAVAAGFGAWRRKPA